MFAQQDVDVAELSSRHGLSWRRDLNETDVEGNEPVVGEESETDESGWIDALGPQADARRGADDEDEEEAETEDEETETAEEDAEDEDSDFDDDFDDDDAEEEEDDDLDDDFEDEDDDE